MTLNIEAEISGLLREIVWNFGSQGIDGQCCDGLSAPEMRALRSVAASQDCSMQHLAQSLGFTKSGATRVVDRLEKKEMVQRQRSPEDGRVCCVQPTGSGEATIRRVNQEAQQRVARVLANMDPGMQQVLLTSLRSFVAVL